MEKIRKAFGLRRRASRKTNLRVNQLESEKTSSSMGPSDLQTSSEEFSCGQRFQREKQTLVLDLDETLVHTQPTIPEESFKTIVLEKDGQTYCRYVLMRPGLLKFMERMSEFFNICIYTCASEMYAKKIAVAVGINKYIYEIYSRAQCKTVDIGLYQKDLWSLGLDPQRTIFVDDFVLQTSKHIENSIQIKPFEGRSYDRELKYLAKFLESLSQVDDIRPISKHFDNFIRRPINIIRIGTEQELAVDDLPDIKDQDCAISEIRVLHYNHKIEGSN